MGERVEDVSSRPLPGDEDGDPVRVVSPSGEARAVARVTDRVIPGRAFPSFHFPETGTNRLTSPVLDRLADCPEYTVTPVRIEAGRGGLAHVGRSPGRRRHPPPPCGDFRLLARM